MTVSKEANLIIREDLNHIVAADLQWSKLQNKVVLITGGGGFLASYFVKALLDANTHYGLNLRVLCLARNIQRAEKRLASYLGRTDFSIIFHDISHPLPTNFPQADFIIHSASQASPKYYGLDPVGTLLANSAGTMYLLEYAKKCNSENFLFFSSGEVYGVPLDQNMPVGELDYGYIDPMNVRSCYAESKRIGETMCVSWSKQFDLYTSVVRPFHTYGPGMALDDGRVFADFVADVVAKRDIVLKSDGLAMRPFCYIADATIGFLTVLLRGGNSEAYNIANPFAEISMENLAVLISNLFPERNVGVRFEKLATDDSYLRSPIYRSCPSIEKIKKLGWSPGTGIEEGFRRTIASFIL
jgi:UDP-glucuronate decarboxylase